MREHISRQKKTTTGFSISSLKHPTPSFSLDSSAISRQAIPEIQPLHKPVTHDISRIPLRSQTKLSVIQPKWEGQGEDGVWIWSGRRDPTEPDLTSINNQPWRREELINDPRAGVAPRAGGGGFFQRGGENRMVTIDGITTNQRGTSFKPEEANDTTEYFDGRLQIHHQGDEIEPQSVGAAFPAIPVAQGALGYEPQQSMAWLQEPNTSQSTERRPENAIMGGSANNAIASSGLEPRAFSPWAHTQPDHTLPLDREDPTNRHPSYLAANQVHSAFESATRQMVGMYGAMPVGRQLGQPIPGGSGLAESMEMSVYLPTSTGFQAVSHTQPYFTQQGARSGDATAMTNFMELEYLRNIAQDAGAISESESEEEI